MASLNAKSHYHSFSRGQVRIFTPKHLLQNPVSLLSSINRVKEFDIAQFRPFHRIMYSLQTLWLFTESDLFTFVAPNTAFGVLGALSGANLTTHGKSSLVTVMKNAPFVILFNWSNVFIFELANQRSSKSVKEDHFNKPWRPLPAGRITMEQTRKLMLLAIPSVLAINTFCGVGPETSILLILTWIYNDLKGGDELIRDVIISLAFGFYNHGSLRIAMDKNAEITATGYTWTSIISLVILTTMQVQDLKDQAGDRRRGRKTLPLAFGEDFSRRSIAIFAALWSVCCVKFWHLNLIFGLIPVGFGLHVSYRVLMHKDVTSDSHTWKWWCLWTVTLYLTPALYGMQG